MFKKNEDWNIWEEEDVIEEPKENANKKDKKKRKLLKRNKKTEKKEEEVWDESGEIDYLSEDSDAIYSKDDEVRYSKKRLPSSLSLSY